MRDYIILNGIRSTLVRGLMICKLPPITKPAIRTTTTTIDGRDGDIVTPLGYQSYDKEIEIGLYGDYDVDEVIKYFDSKGTVTFSNEITKYYNYRIDNQIDFEKLIRFRTAKVTLHVQPFKYSTTELPLEWTYDRPIFSVLEYGDTMVKNGLQLQTINGGKQFIIIGTATADTEIYIPILRLGVQPGDWELDVEASTGVLPEGQSGSIGADNITFRLIRDTPSDAHSFGGQDFQLVNDSTAYITASSPSAAMVFNYIYLTIPSGSAINAAITPTLAAVTQITETPPSYKKKIIRAVTNSGNYAARPKITITGSRTITMIVGTGETAQTYTIDMTGTSGSITIDAEAQDAYEGDALKNRYVIGDYSKLLLQPGPNRIEVIPATLGDVDGVTIERYSRWI